MNVRRKTKDRFEENSGKRKAEGEHPSQPSPFRKAKSHHTMRENKVSFNHLSLSPLTTVAPKQHANRDKHKMNEPKNGGDRKELGTERDKSKRKLC